MYTTRGDYIIVSVLQQVTVWYGTRYLVHGVKKKKEEQAQYSKQQQQKEDQRFEIYLPLI